jgi:hypothetical protein
MPVTATAVPARRCRRGLLPLRLLPTRQAEDIITAARQLPFTHRSWQQLPPQAGIPPGPVSILAEQLRRGRVDAKRRDAITALTKLGQPGPAPTAPAGRVGTARPPATLWTERWAETGRRASRAAVTDVQMVHFLRLFAADHWMTVPALEQIAAWHDDCLGGDPTQPVRHRATRPSPPSPPTSPQPGGSSPPAQPRPVSTSHPLPCCWPAPAAGTPPLAHPVSAWPASSSAATIQRRPAITGRPRAVRA